MYFINLVSPLYDYKSEAISDIDKYIFATDSTTISVSIILMVRAHGKYSQGAVKMHTVLSLQANIPTVIHITDGKYHDVTALDEIITINEAV